MTHAPRYRSVDAPLERKDDFFAVDAWAFALPEEEVRAEGVAQTLDWSRSRAMESVDAGELAAVHSSFGYTMRVPGGTVSAAGLTWVGVHPSHRRRGLLSAMIDDHFTRSLGRGEIVSTLFAAETAIYQRFGYGLACPVYTLSLPRGAEFRDVPGSDDLRIRLEDADAHMHADAVRAVLARDPRPGAHAEIGDALVATLFFDPEGLREGHERRRIAIVEDEHGPAAFAVFQRKASFDSSGPTGTGESNRGWAAVTAAAERRLWSVLADLDLMTSMKVTSVAPDSPLIHLLKDVRRPGARLHDQVWLRILDVPSALTARTYEADVDVVIDIADSLIAANAGAWRFTATGGSATVERAPEGAGPDVRMSIQELSAAYLGGPTIDALTSAGLVVESTQGAAAQLSDAFRSRLAPRGSLHF